MNLNQILEARALATVVPHNITAVDKGPWMVVQYVPVFGTGGAAATVEVEAATLTFTVDGATPAGTDAIGTDGSFNLTGAAHDTMGELVDKINAILAWRAYLVGALRSDTSGSLVVAGSQSCFGDNGATLFSDTSTTKEISIAISGEKFINNGRAGHLTDAGDQCENSMLYASVLVTGGTTQDINYFTGKQGTAEVQLGSSVDMDTAVEKEQGEANLAEVFVAAKRGERLIVRFQGGTTAPTAPAFHVDGKTAVLKNDRFVDSPAYTP